MNILKLIFSKKEYPYSKELHDRNIIWGHIKLNVYSDKNLVIKELVDLEWDIRDLVYWVLENKRKILEERLSITGNNKISGSIAKGIYDFYNKGDCFNESLLDYLFEYRQSHGIRFGLRGTEINDIYMGLNERNHEISFHDGKQSWKYDVDLSSFIKSIENEYSHFVDSKNNN